MRNVQNLEEEKFYLTEENQFHRIYEIISRMPNFILYDSYRILYEDLFYDTKDKFFEQNRATIRVRTYVDKKVLSIKYLSSNAQKEERVREAYLDLPSDADITTNREAHLFLSNKINDIYARRLDIDTIRKMRDLKPYLAVYTNREVYELKNNMDLKISVYFDRCDYKAKFTKDKDNIVKFVLNNYPDTVNLDVFNRFIKNVNEKVYFINDNESKFECAKRILNYDRFNKKRKFEEDEKTEETNNDNEGK
ncbi:MAG: CYTH domain-containing protein [Clostridiales bacterium]|nr:CYTH domain-containing protein [Clostridiales bacterium]